jgi:hypothetical protein
LEPAQFVKIIKCNDQNYWYNDKIGQIYQVAGPELKKSPPLVDTIAVVVPIFVAPGFGWSYIDDGDYVFLSKIKLFNRYDLLLGKTC